DSSATKQRKNLPAQLEPAPAGSPAIASSSTERIHGNDTQDKPAASRTPAARHGTAATPPTSETATVGQATGAQVDLTNKPISRASEQPTSPRPPAKGTTSTVAESKATDSSAGKLAAAPGVESRNSRTEMRPSIPPPA